MKKHKLVCVQLIASADSSEYILSQVYIVRVSGAFSHVKTCRYFNTGNGFNRAMHHAVGVMTLLGEADTEMVVESLLPTKKDSK
jgi:hypothetical protein